MFWWQEHSARVSCCSFVFDPCSCQAANIPVLDGAGAAPHLAFLLGIWAPSSMAWQLWQDAETRRNWQWKDFWSSKSGWGALQLPFPGWYALVNQEHGRGWERAGSAHIFSLVSIDLWNTIAFGSSSKAQPSFGFAFGVCYFDIWADSQTLFFARPVMTEWHWIFKDHWKYVVITAVANVYVSVENSSAFDNISRWWFLIWLLQSFWYSINNRHWILLAIWSVGLLCVGNFIYSITVMFSLWLLSYL